MAKRKSIINQAAPYFIGALIGVAIGFTLAERQGNNRVQRAAKKAQEVELVNQKAKDSLGSLLQTSRDSVRTIEGLRYQDSLNLALERRRIIPKPRVKELEDVILEKGPNLYGEAHADNNRRALVASYGANAVIETDYNRRIIREQKVQIVYIGKILTLENEIRVEYQKGLELAARECKKPNTGAKVGLGALGMLLIILLL